MSDILESDTVGNSSRSCSRPTLTQVKTLLSYMEKHPDISYRKQRLSANNSKLKKKWAEITNTLNAIDGSMKSMQGWIKFWSDKKRFIQTKQRQIDEGRLKCGLTQLEQRILTLCDKTYTPKKRKTVKEEPCNGDDDGFDSQDDVFVKGESVNDISNERLLPTESELKQLTMIEKMVDVMDQQAAAMTQIAQASVANSKALERIAEATHIQAMAVDRLVGTFENISASTHDIRNAILGIDYTLKRCYPTQQRQNSTLFS